MEFRIGVAAGLTAGLLAGCSSDRSVTGPDREPAPTAVSAATPIAETRTAEGYAWADRPSAASYHPSANYAFNRSGGAITVTKPAGTTGRYAVRFPGLS